MMNASLWLPAYPASHVELISRLLFSDAVFPANWESLLAVLGHPHASPGRRRFVISILYLQLCLVPEHASHEP